VVRSLPVAFLGLTSALFLHAQTPTVSGCPVFPSNNIWNMRVDTLPVDPHSDAYVQTLGATSKGHSDFGMSPANGIPYGIVPGNQPKFDVSFYYDGDKGPYPIPPNPPIEAGSDHHLLIVDKDNCILYELFNLQKQSNGSWLAGSGAIFPLNSNQLRAAGDTSADAAGLPMFPGLVRYDEVLTGHINHALRFTGMPTGNRYIWPARHFASSYSGSAYPPMGQRFRLKQSFDISKYGPHMQVVLTALKEYGMILADNGASWFVSGAPDPRWNDDEMHQMTWLVGADFEAVDESALMVSVNSAQAALPGTSIPTGWVNIVNKYSGKCLDMTGGPGVTATDQAPLDKLQQWSCNGGMAQKFKFIPQPGGWAPGSSSKWLSANGNGYQIQCAASGLSVFTPVPAAQNGVRILQDAFVDNSNWIWIPVLQELGYYSIKSLANNLVMDDKLQTGNDNGSLIQQWAWLGGDNQLWKIVPAQ
jgi:hypothetical protein